MTLVDAQKTISMILYILFPTYKFILLPYLSAREGKEFVILGRGSPFPGAPPALHAGERKEDSWPWAVLPTPSVPHQELTFRGKETYHHHTTHVSLRYRGETRETMSAN